MGANVRGVGRLIQRNLIIIRSNLASDSWHAKASHTCPGHPNGRVQSLRSLPAEMCGKAFGSIAIQGLLLWTDTLTDKRHPHPKSSEARKLDDDRSQPLNLPLTTNILAIVLIPASCIEDPRGL